ncbi:ShlB/FhaC/HecB family hemolysin secretion/activation protein [Acaryochloris sp. IP29b_bin.148]|uniref:ShlB/FhaC/HecB family hemolysin secretion/activation protein n=1 Tax=Acaryochloris sp. IP29b_bin.148 TaxID=2969218 RepID=UPI002629A61D|nr:ShlB/FhaC/HecB family hemolysin secretion/activation protein [Acaryochloris sp. IP29b_bin.148]
MRFIVGFGSVSVVFSGASIPAQAQTSVPPGVDLPPTTPSTIERTLPTPSETAPRSIPNLEAPPDSNLKVPDLLNPPEPGNLPEQRFPVRQIEVLGNTVLQYEITQLVTPFENRDVTFNELIGLRSAITQLYIDNGYITSGAFLPNNQDLSDGVVQIQVVEGEIERIEIRGLKRLRESYVRDRINLGTDPPLNQQRLERELQLLQLDPLIEKIETELTAGSTPGQNILLVDIDQAPGFQTNLAFDNYRAPSVGTLQGTVDIAHNNVLGFGDRIFGTYSLSDGLNTFDLGYNVPINARNGSVGVQFSNSDSEIVEAAFRDLGIKSDSQTLSFNLRQPIIRNPEQELALGLGFDLRRSQTFLLDNIPFSFSPGPREGESKVRVLRFTQDWIDRKAQRILAARSQFSWGLNIFDATVNDTGPSAEFFSWLGQFQWVQQLSARHLMVTQVRAQLTPDSLLPLEKFSMGGIDTVRGYAQNQLLADNGVLASVELRIPLLSDVDRLQLTPFVEMGQVWNNSGLDLEQSTLASIGLGARWNIYKGLRARVDFGIPLINTSDRGNSLQEAGFYFSLQYTPPGF